MKLKRVEFYIVSCDLDEHDFDLLRYDLAFISEKHPRLVAFPTFRTKHGDLGGIVTHGNWGSRKLSTPTFRRGDMEHYDLQISLTHDDWTTYRHPTKKYKPTDYGRLVAVPYSPAGLPANAWVFTAKLNNSERVPERIRGASPILTCQVRADR